MVCANDLSTYSQSVVGLVLLWVMLHLSASRKINGCFERAFQLLSLLVPVSDINRVVVGDWGCLFHTFLFSQKN
jgi:hypothetical protein